MAQPALPSMRGRANQISAMSGSIIHNLNLVDGWIARGQSVRLGLSMAIFFICLSARTIPDYATEWVTPLEMHLALSLPMAKALP
jgi:hypothetical protein